MNQIITDPKRLEETREEIKDNFKYHETREVQVQMPFGTTQTLKTHWFKSAKKAGCRKRGPKPKGSKRKGIHVYLEKFGFADKVASSLRSRALKYSALCPSNEIASNLLRDDELSILPIKFANRSKSSQSSPTKNVLI